MPIPREIDAISQQLKKGETPAPQTTRTILRWFGASRRGDKIVQRIRADLRTAGIRTQPDFENAYIDGSIQFFTASPTDDTVTETLDPTAILVSPATTIEGASALSTALGDPTYRLSRLKSANNEPVSVVLDASLEEAVSKMMSRDFSQLPVMAGEREVKGAVSWQSIGKRLALGVTCKTARDCMDPVTVVQHDMSIFEAIGVIVASDFVLVRQADRTISGIVTTSDLGLEFGRLGEPFLLLGEIENHLRRLLSTRFTVKELQESKDPEDAGRKIEGPEDLTLGQVQRFLGDPERWTKLGLSLDRKEFINTLDEVREIRNDTMHFDPDGVLPGEVEKLREFVQFMRELRSLGLK